MAAEMTRFANQNSASIPFSYALLRSGLRAVEACTPNVLIESRVRPCFLVPGPDKILGPIEVLIAPSTCIL